MDDDVKKIGAGVHYFRGKQMDLDSVKDTVAILRDFFVRMSLASSNEEVKLIHDTVVRLWTISPPDVCPNCAEEFVAKRSK